MPQLTENLISIFSCSTAEKLQRIVRQRERARARVNMTSTVSSKLNKMMKTKIYLQVALLGLIAGTILSSCFHGFQLNMEEPNRGHFAESLVEILGNVARRLQDGTTTLLIKFLHFFISRCLQFRYSSPTGEPPYAASMLFWVALTRSVSSMSDSPF